MIRERRHLKVILATTFAAVLGLASGCTSEKAVLSAHAANAAVMTGDVVAIEGVLSHSPSGSAVRLEVKTEKGTFTTVDMLDSVSQSGQYSLQLPARKIGPLHLRTVAYRGSSTLAVSPEVLVRVQSKRDFLRAYGSAYLDCVEPSNSSQRDFYKSLKSGDWDTVSTAADDLSISLKSSADCLSSQEWPPQVSALIAAMEENLTNTAEVYEQLFYASDVDEGLGILSDFTSLAKAVDLATKIRRILDLPPVPNAPN